MDYSQCKVNKRLYGGSERKIGIIVNGDNYMIKFPKITPFGKRSNHISEYLGSKIYCLLGIDVQDVLLGSYKGEEVVLCKDFLSSDTIYVPFNDVGESTLETNKEQFQYSYEDIMTMLHDNSKLTNVNETIDAFWDMFIVDAFIGNFDRHGSNWGFLKENNQYRLAPVFDNGSSLFPNLTDEEIKDIINNEEEMLKRVYTFPTSQIKLNNKKSSYYDVINSLAFKECNEALIRIYKKIDLSKINSLIDSTIFISDIRKDFYKKILLYRYNLIIKNSYIKLEEVTNEGN